MGSSAAEPYFHFVPAKRYRPSGRSDTLSEFLRPVEVTDWHAYFAATVPYLPDFSDPALVRESQESLPVEAVDRQVRFLNALAGLQSRVAFDLRYLTGRSSDVRLVFVGRLTTGYREQSEREVRDTWQTFARAFPRGYPMEPVTGEAEFHEVFQPFAFRHIVELRRHEASRAQGFYFVYPFAGSSQSMTELCRELSSQQQSLLVSCCVRPAALLEEEAAWLNWMASRLSELSQQDVEGFRFRQRMVDEDAAVGAELYRGLLRELREPLMVRVTVASDEPLPESLLAVLAAELTQPTDDTEPSRPFDGAAARRLATAVDRAAPDSDGRGESLAAHRNLYLLDHALWGLSIAPPGMGRVRHLFGSKHASCAFRLPIPQKEGIDGVEVRRSAPFRRAWSGAKAAPGDRISMGRFLHREGVGADELTVAVRDLTKHALVVGMTGSGKTTTCFHVLAQLWRDHHVPFLVIEPVKSEYRALLEADGFSDLQVFTLGDDRTSPFRLNPFALHPGVRLERHIGYLKAVFGAALPLFGPLPMIIESALYRIYQERGWQAADDGRRAAELSTPTLGDFYEAVVDKIDQEGYAGEVRANVEAASRVRIQSLRTGSKGETLDTRHSVPLDLLFQRPTVLELKEISDNDEKAFLVGLLLMLLYEYSEVRPGRDAGGLCHVTLVEEAHRLLRNVSTERGDPEVANTRGRAVEAFCDMLSEVRGLGEGIIIADQIPTRLAPDAIKNTNLKVMHLITAEEDRQVLGDTMDMSDEEKDFITTLRTGQAAVYSEELGDPVLVAVPDAKTALGVGGGPISDDLVRERMAGFRSAHKELFAPFSGCPSCPSSQACPGPARARPLAESPDFAREVARHTLGFLAGGVDARGLQQGVTRAAATQIKGRPTRDELAGQSYCAFAQAAQRYLEARGRHYGFSLDDTERLVAGICAALASAYPGAKAGAVDPAELRRRHQELCRPLYLPYEGCERCEAQCLYAFDVGEIGAGAHEALVKAFREETDAGGRTWPEALSLAKRLVASRDEGSLRAAAYCLLATEIEHQGFEKSGAMLEFFSKRLAGGSDS